MNAEITSKFRALEALVGKTPLMGIKYRYKGKTGVVYAKCEYYNFTGSIKDRMALLILKESYREGRLRVGDRIVEATSGNTGIAFSAMGRLLGHPVSIIMPDWLSVERRLMMKSLGAEIISVSREEGGFLGSIRLSEQMAVSSPQVFLPHQFSNPCNIRAHETTGREIYLQLKKRGLRPDAFIAGVGTGGTVMGVGRFLKDLYPGVKIHPLEPRESPTLSTGYKSGSHRIQGISDEFIPEIMYAGKLDSIIQVSDGDAILMAQQLARSLGLAVGISSGANFLGAIQLQEQYGRDSVVVTVFPDCNKKYLTTDLLKEQCIRPGYLSPEIVLMELEGIR